MFIAYQTIGMEKIDEVLFWWSESDNTAQVAQTSLGIGGKIKIFYNQIFRLWGNQKRGYFYALQMVLILWFFCMVMGNMPWDIEDMIAHSSGMKQMLYLGRGWWKKVVPLGRDAAYKYVAIGF